MPLPPELLNVPEETTVVGDIEKFMDYVMSGRASWDFTTEQAKRLKELDEVWGSYPDR